MAENDIHTLHWNGGIVYYNSPDIALKGKTTATTYFIDIAVPDLNNFEITWNEKITCNKKFTITNH